MSFDANDMNTIHLGNYEEFFILYMDNELSEGQVKMVDEFLAANPDLRAEFEILMGTKLPLEELNFDKKELLAENMKLTAVDEELLLYIDNELSADKKKIVDLAIASNKEYRLELQTLLQTRLDASEKIQYPYKKELYRRTERAIAMKIWMRVAAAVVVLALGGLFYFRNSSHTVSPDSPQNTIAVEKNPSHQHGEKKDQSTDAVRPSSDNPNNNHIAVIKSSEKKKGPIKNAERKKEENLIAQNPIVSDNNQQEEQTPERRKVRNVPFDGTDNIIALNDPKIPINKTDVTSSLVTRTTFRTPEEPGEPNDRKGSIKGFLRKATRMIEKRTGFDPANDNGELLIGAVTISLK